MYLEKGNLKIRDATKSDATILCEWWNDGKVMSHAGFPKGLCTSKEKVLKLLEQCHAQKRLLMIEFNDVAIGEMNFKNKTEDTAEIGIKICDLSQQNRGVGTDSLKMLISHLFTVMGYNRIVLDTNLKNKRAQHVYEKLGFSKISIHENSWQDQLGTWQSSVDYQLNKAEFKQTFP